MIISGGRSKSLQDILPTELYDTETSEWRRFQGLGLYRHSCFIKENFFYIYGGFENTSPTLPIEKLIKIDLLQYFKSNPGLCGKIEGYTLVTEKKVDKENVNTYLKNNNLLDNNSKQDQKFKISNQVVVVKFNDQYNDDLGLIKKVSIDKLNDESKRIGFNNTRSNVQTRRIYNEDLINKFIETLLRPFDWYTPEVEDIHQNLPFTNEDIDSLLLEAHKVISRDSSLVRIRSPVKVFGNLFGQYNDLMRFFESYGHPSDDNQMGDIHTYQYVFLGDICDRGNYSLEVIFLLLALKVRYPDHIYIVRGHHEDININSVFGLAEECDKRLNDNYKTENPIFMKINNLFDILPLAVLIDGKTLCVHGGIGSSVSKLLDIGSIKRPVSISQDVRTHEQQVLIDLLWSEYSDDITDIAVNEERDITKSGFILKYGKERLNKFLADNKLNLLITAHQWISDGIKSYNNDKLVIVCSSTNYMDKYNNIGGMINITRNSQYIIPKLIDVYKNDRKNYRPSKLISPVRKPK